MSGDPDRQRSGSFGVLTFAALYRRLADVRKKDELSSSSTGCLAKAKPDEMIFVLLGRDPASPGAIRHWARNRIAMGKNQDGDEQIREALACADTMEHERKVFIAIDTLKEVRHLVTDTPCTACEHLLCRIARIIDRVFVC